MIAPQPKLIATLQKHKKRFIALFLIVLIALTIFILVADQDHPAKTEGELSSQLQKKSGTGKADLVEDIAASPNVAVEPSNDADNQLLSQADDASVAEEFCMVDSIKFDFPYLYVKTFTNLRSETCNTKSLYDMNLASIKAQLITLEDSKNVLRSGPFGYAMTKNLSFSDHPFIFIGVQRFTQYSSLRLGITDVIKNPAMIFGGDITRALAFYPLKTKENISIYYAPNQMTHALVDPKGTVYLLSAFNKRLLPELNRDNLSVISEMINPPKGWKFVSEKITKPLFINKRSEGGYRNVRLVDNLGNIYIKLSEEEK
jgi:hypothetical protein